MTPKYDEDEPQSGLVVQLAAELVTKAKAQGVSLVGPDGLLAGVTRTVLQAALEAPSYRLLGQIGPHRSPASGGEGMGPPTHRVCPLLRIHRSGRG